MMRRFARAALLITVVLAAAGCGDELQDGTSTMPHPDPTTVTTSTVGDHPPSVVEPEAPDDDSYEYPDEQQPPTVDDGDEGESGVSFVDGWSVERGEVVGYGPEGATVFDWIDGTERRLTDDGLAGLVAGPWGLVFQATGGEGPHESTAAIWWVANADSQPVRVVEGEGSLVLETDDFDSWAGVMQLYDVIEWNEEFHAILRLEAYQNDDLWILQPLAGGPPHEIGFLSGADGGLEVPCVAWDGVDLYLASDGHDSQIVKVSPSGERTWFLPGGRDDVWPYSSTCVAARSDGGVVVLHQPWAEDGSDPTPELLVVTDPPEGVDSTLVLSDMYGLIRVDATDNGVILLSDLDGFHWLGHEEGEHPSQLSTDHPFARFVD